MKLHYLWNLFRFKWAWLKWFFRAPGYEPGNPLLGEGSLREQNILLLKRRYFSGEPRPEEFSLPVTKRVIVLEKKGKSWRAWLKDEPTVYGISRSKSAAVTALYHEVIGKLVLKDPGKFGFIIEEKPNILDSLKDLGVIVDKDYLPIEGAYILTFSFKNAVTTIGIRLKDLSGPDLVITAMTTLPDEKKSKGWGGLALWYVLELAKLNGFVTIRAAQVDHRNERSEQFWIKNGFVRAEEPNPTNDFIYRF